MRKATVALSVFLLSVAAPAASAQEVARDSMPGLEAEYTMQVGDYAAILLPEFLRIGSNLGYPVVVTYEPEPNRLDIEIFGDQVTVEQARQIVGGYWEFIQTLFFPYAERRLGVTLDEGDFAIIYYDASEGDVLKPVVQMADGQFMIP